MHIRKTESSAGKAGDASCKRAQSTGSQLWLPRILVTLLLISGPPASAVEIVCNRDVSITRLSTRQLQAIFTMRLRAWPNGLPIRVFVLDDNSPMHIEFAKKIMEMFPYQLRRYWDKLVFSGTGQAPVELETPQEVYDRVVATPGAIGYLPTNLVDGKISIVAVSEP